MNATTGSKVFNVDNPVELARKLIRFDTTNPPGNEVDCITYIDSLLADAGV